MHSKKCLLALFLIIKSIVGRQSSKVGHPFYSSDDTESSNEIAFDENNEERITITFPGTKWCGPGNIAGDYGDLGKYKETDKCCREHDNCENIPAGGEKYGLKNNDWFTRLHCDCDKTFYQCLHTVNGTVSNVIGRQYFLVRDKCFKEDNPVVECIEYQRNILVRRCIKYRFDKTLPKKYQWFDLPLYDSGSYPNFDDDEGYYQIQKKRQHEIQKSQTTMLE